MDAILQNIQFLFFKIGSNKDFCIWDKIGNKIQDFRSKYTI